MLRYFFENELRGIPLICADFCTQIFADLKKICADPRLFLGKSAGKRNLDIASISYEMAISERQLFRNIKRITGLTPNKYIRSVRLQIAREAIESGKYKTLSEISYVAGFETPAYFSKLFKELYGRDVNDLIR